MADATDLKSVDRKVVRVRLPPSAPTSLESTNTHYFESENYAELGSVDRVSG